MNQTDPWVVTYKDFQGCTERLTDEVDRLTSQTRAATAVLESSAKCTEHVEAVGMQIAQQVKNAEMAWSKADEVAVQADYFLVHGELSFLERARLAKFCGLSPLPFF